jgi:hypothetical protein
MLAYGAVNAVQDLWGEQLVKRGATSWGVPSALEPSPDPIWLVILGIAVVAAVTFRREARR